MPAGSTAQSPLHTYTAAGIYNITLQVFNATSYNSTQKTGYITVTGSAPVAGFTANVTSGTAPFSVQFNDTSTNAPMAWNWSFGDGNYSVVQNATHTYTFNDTFSVSLNATNADGSNVSTRTNYIIVTAPKPIPDFSANVTSGTAPLPVSFTDHSTGNPNGWTWFFGDENYNQSWTEMNASAGWTARYDHSSVVMPDGSIVLMGGWDGSLKNDVWRSTDNGTTWAKINASAGWTARYSHSSVVMPDGSIVLMGGNDGNSKNDTWRSRDDGATWIEMNASSGWAARYYHSSVAMPDGSIVLMGGNDGSNRKNDTWRSTDNGAHWTQVNASAGWSARDTHSSVAMADGSIVLMGGGTISGDVNDVWLSKDEGATWTEVNASAGWLPRNLHSSVAMADGSIVLMGGSYGGSDTRDVWRSTDDGATWTEVNASAGWTNRDSFSSVTLPDGSIVLMGGTNIAYYHDVWRFVPTGSSVQSPSHIYTAAGNYMVALQAYNAGGFNSTRKAGYINVTGSSAPGADFNATVTSGTAPLAVQFYDNSSGSPTSWNWSFGDGNFSALQNPSHTYAFNGTFTVALNATSGGGSNVSTRTNYIVVNVPKPIPGFSANVTSGTAPLPVSFTDLSLDNPTGWTWFFGDENYSAAWTQVTPHAAWIARDSHSSVAMPDGSIVLMGGLDNSYNYRNDSWQSTDDGVTWTQLNASSGWSARGDFSSVAMPDGSIVLMGGYNGIALNDTWRSKDHGITWTLMSASAEWSARSQHTSVSLPDGSIILMGGLDGSTRWNDVWRSTDDGATWTEINGSAGWTARRGFSSVALPDGSIVLTGGDDGADRNDTWRSTDNGITWTLMNASSGWSPRDTHTSVALPDDSIVLTGGWAGSGAVNDVWRSTDDGATWAQVNASAGLTGRYGHTSVALPDGSVVVMGGWVSGLGIQNDTWQFQPSGSSFQNPSHTYTAAGNYSVALQAYNTGGYNSTRKTGYINVTGLPAPVAGFTSNVTSGTVPLAVQFSDNSTGSPTSWNWSFGDGNFSSVQNPAHTYAFSGSFTVALNATNAGGSNLSTRTNYIIITAPKPIPDFSANITNGTAPLPVSFTDASLNSPTGWAWFFGDENYTQLWTEMNASAGWAGRFGQSSVGMPDGSIVLMGGYDGSILHNDTWRSMDDGATWTEVNISPGWSARVSPGTVVLPDGSIVLMGGYDATNYRNDVWRSTDNGVTWTEINASAGWSAREIFSSVAMPDGSIVLTGGLSGGSHKNDVWRSTDDGASWTEVNASAGWSARYAHSTVVLPDGSIVLLGGQDIGNYKNDVWRSTDNGVTWTEVNANAGWTIREGLSSVVMPDGSIVLMGGMGSGNTNYNDTWRSDDKGVTWTEVNPNDGWVPRTHHSSVAMPDGSIVVMGGWDSITSYNDTWRFNPTGSSAQNPSHTYTVAGNYTVALQAYNAGAFNSTRKIRYINVTGLPAPFANFTVTLTSGTAPLAVQFYDNSTGSPTSWNWSFGDGNFSTLQNPVHTYAFNGMFTVALNATNAGGSNVSVQTNYITVTVPKPIPDFSANITSGTAPFPVSFADASLNSPTGWAWYFGDENYTAPWTEVNASAGWSARDGHSTVAMPDGSIVLTGGYDGSVGLDDVWRSGDNGVHWTLMNASAGWPVRWAHSSVAMPDGSIVLMGGYDGSTYKNDVWRSMDDGTTWTLMNASAGWSARFYLTSVAMPDGSIVLMGGGFGGVGHNDVWRSMDDGATWTEVNASAGWSARSGHSGAAMPDGSIVLMGGNDGTYKNDTWRSTDEGVTWTEVNASAGWESRQGHTCVVLPDGSLVLMGGRKTGGFLNDAWRSADSGATWTEVNASAGWSGRIYPDSLAMPDGSIVLMGGQDSGGNRNDVWRFMPAGSSAQSPSHTYATAGIYQVALQAFNAGGYNSTRRAGYVNVTGSPAPLAIFSASVTTGTAPLAVQFNDTSANAPTGWNWSFRNVTGNNTLVWWSTVRNASLTFGTGNFSIELNASNSGGYNLSTQVTFINVTTGVVAPIAGFAANVTSGIPPLAVQFNDTSTNTPTKWNWSFRNVTGNNTQVWWSTLQNATRTFGAGNYSIRVNASNSAGYNVSTQATFINVSIPAVPHPVASFTASPLSGSAPLGVQFTDTSTNTPTKWNWSFRNVTGNNTQVWWSTLQNATRTFGAGNYSIRVNASNSGGYNVSTQVTFVNVTAAGTAPVASFTASPLAGNAFLTVQFTDTSTRTPTAWDWSFRDVTGNDTQVSWSTAENPSLRLDAGNYSIALNAGNSGGYNLSTQVTFINVSPAALAPPLPGFIATPSSGSAPLTVQFTDTSSNIPTSWNWSFGDGNFSVVQDPVHLFSSIGLYNVTLNATNTYGSDAAVQSVPVSDIHAAFTWLCDPTGTVQGKFPEHLDHEFPANRIAVLGFRRRDHQRAGSCPGSRLLR